ncbi:MULTISPECIES: GDSL-type esterase/lipase family protein [unclassified Clostridium]|uniref:GDSL-type esterase/lipase family protein n=1 Tax=unclassified Clostridium TaxID=2614128 RepID=UPI0025BA0707|nr:MULTISPECIES: GDSL-type esterase/lipase family protein [unclassified Clostridium]
MKGYRRRKRRKLRIVNPKRFFTSITVTTLVVLAVSIPIKNYVFKSVFGKNTASAKSNVNIDKNNDNKIEDFKESGTSKKKDKDTLNIDKVNQEKNNNTNSSLNNSNQAKKVEIDNKEFFKNAVFMGDSIAESLGFYEFLDESRVIAAKGHTVIKAQKDVDKVASLSPENIFILFGMNDLETGIDGQQFAKNYADLIHMLKEKLPKANIYIHSILPINEEVQKEDPLLANTRVDEFNKALINMAQKEEVNYFNIAPLLKEHKDLYEPDGKHTKYQFYELWLDYIKNNVK